MGVLSACSAAFQLVVVLSMAFSGVLPSSAYSPATAAVAATIPRITGLSDSAASATLADWISLSTFAPTSSSGPMAATTPEMAMMMRLAVSEMPENHCTMDCSADTMRVTAGSRILPKLSPICLMVWPSLRAWLARLSPVRTKSPCAFFVAFIT